MRPSRASQVLFQLDLVLDEQVQQPFSAIINASAFFFEAFALLELSGGRQGGSSGQRNWHHNDCLETWANGFKRNLFVALFSHGLCIFSVGGLCSLCGVFFAAFSAVW